MSAVKVSVVSYLNSKPFVYGLKNSSLFNDIELSLDMPSVCAQKLIDDKVDLGLVPVAIIPELKNAHIISDYCIAAEGKVNSVCLYSNVQLNKIEKIILDYQSRTSVNLVKILAKEFWHINPIWESAQPGFEGKIKQTTAAVIIGDRTFELENAFEYCYDLAEEWQKFTGLPFVFACWVSNKKLNDEFISNFNRALGSGIENIKKVINELGNDAKGKEQMEFYLTKCIHFHLDERKRKAMNTFLGYLKKLK